MRLLLIDGHYYLYRSFHAIGNLRNSKGEPTNAIYGFIQAVRRMIADLRPDLGAIIWDAGLSARRVALQPSYKQNRPAMPQPLRRQESLLKELCPYLGFSSLSLPQVEADDLLASYTEAAVIGGIEVNIATSDKDLFQLVRPGVFIYATSKADSTGKGFSLLGEEFVLRKWGVAPCLIGEVLALTGDVVDNIPGINGVGPKTAALLVQAYGGITGLLENLDRVKNKTLRAKLEANRSQIIKNLGIVRLDLHIPLPSPLANLHIQPRYAELIHTLERYEFGLLSRAIEREAAKEKGDTEVISITQGWLFKDVQSMQPELGKQRQFATFL
ncbi:MAG: flap endonuclease [Candidatus Xiphinematobacter sp.]|nr:MAG: flap endonuclease [Candidatus Xiphinematobacter sp.]QQY09727.1 MAG: flap endonuclease [Candidatus Xiphinematobacter sp.]QQY10470.1 MAG: flap endonuclease [Candidatus Xiphinematobacter sp.]QQY11206.1 MAG: flap endonuclease [Candidatus Xiphinematobacter sp.]